MDTILLIVYIVLSWKFLSDFQDASGIGFLGSLKYYFFFKLVLCALFGWAIIPIGIIRTAIRIIVK